MAGCLLGDKPLSDWTDDGYSATRPRWVNYCHMIDDINFAFDSYCVYCHRGSISQRVLISYQNLVNIHIAFTVLEKWLFDPVTILHMSRQLSCCDMRQFVAWDWIINMLAAERIFTRFDYELMKRAPELVDSSLRAPNKKLPEEPTGAVSI